MASSRYQLPRYRYSACRGCVEGDRDWLMMTVLTDEDAAELPIPADGALDYGAALEGIEAEVTSPNCQYTAGGRTT
jgi:hypothetical protein